MILAPLPLQFVIGLSAVLALFIGLILHFLIPDWRWHHEPLHSAMEALGGVCAIVMAIVLFRRSVPQSDRTSQALAVGFLSMGVLEEFHAVSVPGNAFIFLRSLASLFGGIGFALVWLPAPKDHRPRRSWLLGITAVGAVTVGTLVLGFPDYVPEMLRNGEFSPTAVAPTSLASLFFLAAALRFFLDYQRRGMSEDYLFACLALLFGLAELMFTYSLLWDARWWFWHGLRLVAYLLILGYMVTGYQRMVSDLKASLFQRERMAQNLHDGSIQSLFALSLNLERCQRLVTKDPEEVIRHLGLAVTGLKSVIRDLRSYIVGTEPIADGRDLEAALALQVKMTESSDLQFSVHVDPAVSRLVDHEQASHLLYIAREAISNSVRHAQAHHVTLLLALSDSHVRLVVEDDGIGFNRERCHKGEGLKNIAGRAARLNAQLTIESSQGTRLVLDVPKEGRHA